MTEDLISYVLVSGQLEVISMIRSLGASEGVNARTRDGRLLARSGGA